jgi:hypothetical protein
LRFPISFINTATLRASTRRIARVNRHDTQALKLRLVFDKAPQLVERPTMQSSTLLLHSSYSISNTAKFFDGYTLIECLRSRYYPFADYMVRMASKPLFFSTPVSKKLSEKG